jgi:hypothetical protein
MTPKPLPERKELLKRWRSLKLPRLYWKRNNRRWYKSWNSEDVARTKNMRFLSYRAVVEFLEYCEALEKQHE